MSLDAGGNGSQLPSGFGGDSALPGLGGAGAAGGVGGVGAAGVMSPGTSGVGVAGARMGTAGIGGGAAGATMSAAAGRGASGSGAAGGAGMSSAAGAGGAGRGGSGGSSTAGAGGMGASGMGGSTGNPETGRLVGITAAHNMVRAMVQTSTPLPPLTWSPTLAEYAQQWTDTLAMTCSQMHRSSAELQSKGYGENLAAFASYPTPPMSTAQQAVSGWAGEVACWTFGQFMRTDSCSASCVAQMSSDGCGHYTQVVWRKTTQVGCGVSTCTKGGEMWDIWICNYSPAGNFVGQNPY
jgi:hypothetical protein